MDQDELKRLFDYRDGVLYWKISLSNRAPIGKAAGGLNGRGYLRVKVGKRLQLNHRVIFLYFNGYLPRHIDHIDCDPSNNRIENLRPATCAQNLSNRGKPATNTSGFKGVYPHKKSKLWIARLDVNSKSHYLGYFKTPEEGGKAYDDALERLGLEGFRVYNSPEGRPR